MTELAIPVATEQTVIHKPMPVSGYYYVEPGYYDSITERRLVYVYAGRKALHSNFGQGHLAFTYEDDLDEFEQNFTFAPDGAEVRNRQVNALMQEIEILGQTMTNTQGQLTGPLLESENVVTTTALAPGVSSVENVKKMVANSRNTLLKAEKTLKQKTKELSALIEEQGKLLAIRTEDMEQTIAQMQKTIWTINLYLGRDEHIIHLVAGKPEAASTKIKIRQTVLYMDEECAIAAHVGGLDIKSIEEFDEWLQKDPKHLHQVLPESKGIVALHVRRHKKEYGNIWEDQRFNDANLRWTYFLIRNGENLYRVYVDITVGGIIFPGPDYYEDFFTETITDWNAPGRPQTTYPLKPGSQAYMRAMDSAESKRKHFLRIGLVLQGLMDRTDIFKPMPIDRINLCDQRHSEEWLQMIYDNENLISDGRPLFYEWQKTINSQLDVGHRIVGRFCDYSSNLRGDEKYGGPSRIHPQRACTPTSGRLYTIETRGGERNNGYTFYYPRNKETSYLRDRWGNPEWRAPKSRASCWLLKTDRFFLNFDLATLEELNYYMVNRLSRNDYKDMIPILEAAIEAKNQEIEEEAPFHQLLVDQIIKKFGGDQIHVEGQIEEIIRWWKFKNRTHRALLSNDVSALKMIIIEYGLRMEQSQVRQKAKLLQDTIIREICEQNQPLKPLLIAHKSDNKYVALIPQNDQNIWVTEQTWTLNRTTNALRLKESKNWTVVDNRYLRWEIYQKHEKWETWRINPQRGKILTDLEIEGLVKLANDRSDNNPLRYQERFLPLVILCSQDFKLECWYSGDGAIIPDHLTTDDKVKSPKLNKTEIVWKRTNDGIKFERLGVYSTYYYHNAKDDCYWESAGGRTVAKWPENIVKLNKEVEACDEYTKQVTELYDRYDHVSDAYTTFYRNREITKERAKFDADYGDPSLWEDHLKKVSITEKWPRKDLKDILADFALHNINPVGMTLPQVYTEAIKRGFYQPVKSIPIAEDSSQIVPTDEPILPLDLPDDFIIPEKPKETAND